jgi:N-acetylmuramoyl-L-alanine amidase
MTKRPCRHLHGAAGRGSLPALLTMGLLGFVMALATAASAQTGLDLLPPQVLDPEAGDIPVQVSLQADGAQRTVSGRMLLAGSQEMYLSSATAASLFKAGRFWQDMIRQLTLRVKDKEFKLTAGSRLVIFSEGERLLPVPIFALDGDLWLPMEFFVQILGPSVREVVLWDPEASTLNIGSERYNVTGLSVEQLTRATTLHLICEEPLSYRADSSDRGYVVLKIYRGIVNPAQVGLWSRRGLIESVESRQYRDHAKVFVKVDDLANRFRTYTRQDGREIVLVVEEEQVSALPEPVPRGRVNVMLGEGLVDISRPVEVRTVVIDPGHGGVETGKVGQSGTLEKNVNLAIARQLKRYLERKSDMEVLLTRDEDVQLSLDERAEFANRAGGDLFISLHCNGWFNGDASGIETYFLSPAKTDWTKSVAAYENQPADSSAASADVAFILWELVQNKFINTSSDLAEIVQATLCQGMSAPNRGVKQAGFRVLVGTYMPAVLVEMGFLSHRNEERRLNDSSYQRQLAESLGKAILEFKERSARSARLVSGERE